MRNIRNQSDLYKSTAYVILFFIFLEIFTTLNNMIHLGKS